MRRLSLIALLLWSWSQGAVAQDTPHQPPSLLADAVRIAPRPHLSVLVPKGWYACDPDANKSLGGASIPGDFMKKICSRQSPDGIRFDFINPNLTQLMFVASGEWRDASVTAHYFEALPADDLKSKIDHVCEMAKGSQKFSASDCDLRLDQMSGRGVLAGHVSGSPPDGDVQINLRLIAVPRDGSILMLVIADTNANVAVTQPLVDAMIGSVEVD
jgi:hypothetical protein